MKTFETEKGNIPDGATHYLNENNEYYFLWVKACSDGSFWSLIKDDSVISTVKPIPQTNMETPEEKEVLDTMTGISREHLLKMIKLQTKTIKELNTSESPNGSNEIIKPLWAKWSIGDSVTKTKGSSWTGKVVGYYQTDLTSKGYAVESETEKGSVQIYPEAALCSAETEAERVERERVNAIVEMASIAIGPEFDLAINDRIKDICSKIHDAGYRKESE